MFETILFSIILMAAVCLLLGVLIGFAVKIFAVQVDPRIEEIEELLPGANCGGCGKAGCSDFAKALVAGEAMPSGCPVAGKALLEEVAKVLGVDAETGEKQIALVRCGGDRSSSSRSELYNGVNDCASAMLIAGGPKGCSYGCLGFASCARACPFNAIEMVDGLAIVHEDLCVGCGKCLTACPRDLIILRPQSAKVNVYCNSPAKGAQKRKICSVACIGCRKCFKVAEENIEMKGFLATVNYDNPPQEDIIEEAKCPTGCLSTTTTLLKKFHSHD
ncbi:RnfABCDGE type electron transport complex subunit B [Lentisphaerota bacterium WC36G]|nr:RnfABCDGE type electron transport complex subunit B [Lentisphaerae bacterium WC36]